MAFLLLWWFLSTILSLLTLPLTLSLFRHLPDRGYPLARTLGVLLPCFLAWFLGMWQLASYRPALLIFCLLAVAALSALLLWKDRSILGFLHQNRRMILFYEILFAAALLVGALLRIYAPWGGVAVGHTEQPMDFALMNGIIQSRFLPPQDPWLAGYSINYYYLGYFMAASQALLSGLSSAFVFNLNLATLFALTVTGCFSLGYNLTMAADPAGRRRAVAIGLLTIVLALLVGNQIGALQVLTGSNQVAALNAGELWTVLRARLAGQTGPVPLGYTVRTPGAFGDHFDTVSPTPGRQVDDFDWWWPSRVLWDERPTLEGIEQIRAAGQVERAFFGWRRFVSADQITRTYAITEFPFFSFYLGDMHPHVMALPLTLLAIALALNLVLAPEHGRAALGPGRWSWLFLVLSAVVLGGLYMANSWDFPTYLLLYGAAWVWRWRKEATAPWTRRDTWAVVRDLGLLAGLCILLYLPFFLTFRSLVGGREIPAEILETPTLGTLASLPIISKVFQTIGPVFWDKTSLYTLAVIFGLFLYPALTWFVIQGVRRWGRHSLWAWAGVGLGLVLGVLLHFPLLVLVPVVVVGWMLLRSRQPVEALALLMLMLALLLVLGCELVYIRDIFENRMNTIFKFYYQAWMLLAIVGAWSIGELARAHLHRPLVYALWAVPLALLLVGGLVNPVLSLRLAFREQREWTLDGLSVMAKQYPGDYAGVRWILGHTAPDAVVLEAAQDERGYSEWGYTGRVSAATGRPTLLGWDGHEQQWRGGDPTALAQIAPRREAALTIYQTTDAEQTRQLLQQYGVDYVFIGSLESGISTPESLAKFAQLGSLVFEAPGVQIYQVHQ